MESLEALFSLTFAFEIATVFGSSMVITLQSHDSISDCVVLCFFGFQISLWLWKNRFLWAAYASTEAWHVSWIKTILLSTLFCHFKQLQARFHNGSLSFLAFQSFTVMLLWTIHILFRLKKETAGKHFFHASSITILFLAIYLILFLWSFCLLCTNFC